MATRMGDTTLQSNAGMGLNASVGEVNPGEGGFRIVQSYNTPLVLQFTLGLNTNVSTQYRQWKGFTDSTAQEQFLTMFGATTRMFNYYRLVEVEYTFLIGNCSVDNEQYIGPILLRALPWTGHVEAGSGTVSGLYPNISLLGNCENWGV